MLGERPGTGAVAGLLLIIAGSWLSTDGRLPPGPVAALAALRRRRGRLQADAAETRSPAAGSPADSSAARTASTYAVARRPASRRRRARLSSAST